MQYHHGVHAGPPALSEVSFIHEALFGYPPDRHTAIDFLMSLPNARHVTLALLNSPRYRAESRGEVPLWPVDKWVMTDFQELSIWINLNDRHIGVTILDGHYEEELVAEMRKQLPPGATMVDVGANVGVYSCKPPARSVQRATYMRSSRSRGFSNISGGPFAPTALAIAAHSSKRAWRNAQRPPR